MFHLYQVGRYVDSADDYDDCKDLGAGLSPHLDMHVESETEGLISYRVGCEYGRVVWLKPAHTVFIPKDDWPKVRAVMPEVTRAIKDGVIGYADTDSSVGQVEGRRFGAVTTKGLHLLYRLERAVDAE